MVKKISVAKRPQEGIRINLNRQDTLLVLCARINLSPEMRQKIKEILTGGMDWDKLIEKAGWHRLSALVAHHLTTSDLSVLVPKAVIQRMQGIFYKSLAQNMVLQDELSRLLVVFSKEEIPVIVLKGAALLESIYPDISLRPMSDLDILVRPEHLDQAEAIALKQGYGFRVGHDLQEQAKLNDRHLANLWHHEKRIMLEIHHHIVSQNEPYYFKLDDFWVRAKPITISSARALTFATEDLLLHLSIKFLLDRRYQSNNALGQLCDVSEIIRHYGDSLDWDLIEKTSQENGLSKGLHFVLYTCQLLLQTPVPATFLDKVQPRGFNAAAAGLFIRRRVLDTRPWLAHGLLDSQMTFNRRSMFRAIANRFSSVTSGIIKKNGNGDSTGPFALRWVREILPRLGSALLKPGELKDDLKLDRWLHDLHDTN